MCVLRHVQLFVAPWTVTCQPPRSLGFSRQEYWSGLLSPAPGDLSDPRTELESPELAGGFFLTSATWEAWVGARYGAINEAPSFHVL